MLSTDKTAVSVLITTHNEELNIGGCLASVSPWAGQILVLDSGSKDGTLDICQSYGITPIHHGPYEGAAKQRNWALNNLDFEHKWILLLDADERVPPSLAEEIKGITEKNNGDITAYWINRRFIFYGKWIRHSGWYPSWNIRLFRHGSAIHEQRAVGPHLLVSGESGYLQNDLIHEDSRDMSFWIEKHNRYSNWEAQDHLERLSGERGSGFLENAPVHTRIRRYIKDTVWPHLPGRALLIFFYMYIIRLGFLDGPLGFRFCVMHTIFEHFNTVKQWEMRNYKNGARPGGISTPPYFDPQAAYQITNQNQE